MPVVVLQDTVLAVRNESIQRPDTTRIPRQTRLRYEPNGNGPTPPHEGYFQRYALTDSGISPVSVPGQVGGQYVATGLEHSEEGRPRYDAVTKREMTEKRMKKLAAAPQSAPEADYWGDPAAEIGIITWGSTAGPVQEAIRLAAAEGISVAGMAPKMLWPVAAGQIEPFLRGKQDVLVAEVNYSGQLANLLAAQFGRPFEKLTIYAGEAFRVRDILAAIRAKARAAVR